MMNLRSVDLNLLTVFDAVIREQNISRAAEKIGMSQPAMSAAISRLKVVLKDELFVRTGRGVRPTARALELEQPIRHILELVTDTLSPAQDFDWLSSRRTFTIASMDYASVLIVPKLMAELERLNTEIGINICSGNDTGLVKKMRSGDVDFAVDYGQIVDSDIHNQLITSDTASCLVRRGHSVIKGSLSLAQYLTVKQAVLAPYGDKISALDEFLSAKDLVRRRSIALPSLLNYPQIIAATDTICTLPTRVAEVFAEQYGLLVYPFPVSGFKVDYYLMWHKRHDNNAGHQWMRGQLERLSMTL